MQQNNRFLVCALGIFVAYSYFGILQERITKGKYEIESVDENGNKIILNEKFTYALSLVFTQCLINYMIARLATSLWPQVADKTSVFYYSSVSLTLLLAMVCSNMALQWVSYPTQVVGKSAKPIPVMILGALVARKRYPSKKYFFVCLIVIGIVLFMLKDSAASKQRDGSLIGVGEVLLILSLTMDGLSGAIQERIRSEYSPSGYQLMRTSNAWSSIYLAAALLLTGEAFKFLEFTGRHPHVFLNLIILGLTQGVGQIFLYSMVCEFGPLAVSVVTTCRKFFTVLFSVMIFGNVLSTRQWFGTVMVFSGLLLDALFAKNKPAKQDSEEAVHRTREVEPSMSVYSMHHLQS